MLVEFSSWETADTSLRLSLSKRKRRRAGSSSSSSSLPSFIDDDFPMAGSFITTKAGRKKTRKSTESSRAVFTATSSHRVSVLVENNVAGSSNTACLEESSRLQFNARPGDATSFLASHGKEKKRMKQIPVVFDTKNDRFFALQDGNQRLVVWDAQSDGPDQDDPERTQILREQVESLDLLPNGFVLGSCESGSLFYASIDQNTSSLQVEHLPTSRSANRESEHHCMKHAGTLLAVEDHENNRITSLTSGEKRKIARTGEQPLICIVYQVYVTGFKATIRRHELVACNSHSLSLELRKYKEATLSLLPTEFDEQSSLPAENATLVHTTIDNPKTATLYFQMQPKTESIPNNSNQYCCTIDLHSGELKNPPYSVKASPQYLAMITPRLLVMGTDDGIQVHDSYDGAILHSEPLPDDVRNMEAFMLLCDARSGMVLILASREGHLHVHRTTLNLKDEGTGQPLNLLSTSEMILSGRLSAVLAASHHDTSCFKRNTAKLLAFSENEVVPLGSAESSVDLAIRSVQESVSHILKEKGRGYKEGVLLDVFESSVKELTDGLKNNKAAAIQTHGPAGDRAMNNLSLTCGRINGLHVADKLKEGHPPTNGTKKIGGPYPTNGLQNGHAGDEKVVESLPKPFIDAVTLNILCCLFKFEPSARLSGDRVFFVRKDCCMILSRLLSTGKVSGRRLLGNGQGSEAGDHFMQILRRMSIRQTKLSRTYSPIDFMYDVLRYCADVSETQLVTMVQYMFCFSRPIDIALSFAESKDLPTEHPNVALSFRYLKYLDQLDTSNDSCTSFKRKIQETGSKLLMAGSAALLENILVYSQCNQALLSVALRERLSFGCETGLLAGLLAEVAFSRPRSTIVPASADRPWNNKVASACQWIPALLDAFSDEISRLEEGELNELLYLKESLALAIRHTELLISLEDSINEKAASLKNEEGSANNDNRIPKRRKLMAEEDALPAYSIERLSL